MQDSLFPDDSSPQSVTRRTRKRPTTPKVSKTRTVVGIECPKCGAPSGVHRTLNYVSFLVRERICTKDGCHYFFKTTETIDADYRPD